MTINPEYVENLEREAEARERAKNHLPAAIGLFVSQYNERHDLKVTKGAVDYFLECLPEICEDLYAGRAVVNVNAIKPTSEVLLESFKPRQTTNPATLEMQKK